VTKFEQNLKTKLIGIEGQSKLSKAKICIIGAGGTGCPIFLYLHNAGIENICIIDDDVVSESNLNRQFIYDEDDVGKKKVQIILDKYGYRTMKFDGSAMSSQINVVDQKFEDWLEHLAKNDEDLPEFDLIIDATDNFKAKKLVQKIAIDYNIPCLICGVHGYQINMFAWHPDYSTNTYDDLFNNSDETSEKSEGTFPTSVGILGTMVANEAIKILLGLHEKVIYNKIFYYNVLDSTLLKLDVKE